MIFITGGACQGKHAFAEKMFPGQICITVSEEELLRLQKAGEDAPEAVRSRIEGTGLSERLVVIMNETGSGITPIDAEQRRLRDEMGKIGCAIAAEAEEVYRVIAGIGVRIK